MDHTDPDNTGSHYLTKTVSDLDAPKSASLPPGEKTDLLISAIRDLAKANIRVYDDNKVIKKLLVVVVILLAVGAITGGAILWQMRLDAQARAKLLVEVADVKRALTTTPADVAEKVDSAIAKLDAQPQIKLKAQDDPTAEPVAVLEVPPPKQTSEPMAGGKPGLPPKPSAIEIPLGKPRKKEK